MNDTAASTERQPFGPQPLSNAAADSTLSRWAAIPLRLIVGWGFFAHGYAKLARGPDFFLDTVQGLGIPEPHLMGWATIIAELVCGMAVVIGAMAPLAMIPMAAILLVAIYTVHLPFGFSSIKLITVAADGPKFGPPGYEADLLYLACLAALYAGGVGPWSVDRLIGRCGPLWARRLISPADRRAAAARR